MEIEKFLEPVRRLDEALTALYGIPLDELAKQGRGRIFCDLRCIVAHQLHEEGLGLTEIGNILGRAHSVAYHSIVQASNLLSSAPYFKEEYNKIKNYAEGL